MNMGTIGIGFKSGSAGVLCVPAFWQGRYQANRGQKVLFNMSSGTYYYQRKLLPFALELFFNRAYYSLCSV